MFGLNFDLLALIILTGMVMIGYISGATIEIIKLIRIYVPFIVVFYLGGPISRWIYKSGEFNHLVDKISFLQGIYYFNTIVMLLSTIIAFVGSYFIIGLIIKMIQKRLQSEIVTYKLGKINNYFGAVIAVARYYVIISILLLPFFMLGLTSRDSFSTNFVLNYPPPYTQIGRLVNSSEPAINVSHSLTNFMNMVDINQLKEDYTVVTDLPKKMNEYESQVENSTCQYNAGEGNYPYLTAYVNAPCADVNLQGILRYKGLINWVNDNQVDLNNLTDDQLIQSFNEHYKQIIQDTTDPSMQIDLQKAHKYSQIYLVIDSWLKNTLSGTYDLSTLLDDNNIQKMIQQLNIDYGTKDSQGLFHDLYQLDYPEYNTKLQSLEKFVVNYQSKYEPRMQYLPNQLPYKYKLIASSIDFDFLPPLQRTPLIAMYAIDTLQLLDRSGVHLIDKEPLYDTFVKIMFPLYIMKKDDSGNLLPFTKNDMENFLTKKCSGTACSIDQALDKVIITKDFFLDLMSAFVDDNDGQSQSYVEELYSENLLDKDAVVVLENYFVKHYQNDAHYQNDDRIQNIIDALDKVGEANG